MKILILGGTGFVGRNVAGRLLYHNHDVTITTRDVLSARNRFPGAKVQYIDIYNMKNKEDWFHIVEGMDVVINCIGILQSQRKNESYHIHYQAPKACLEACIQEDVKKFIHLSAITANENGNTDYEKDKSLFENVLSRTIDLKWTILKPSIIYGTGSYGGTSLIRGISSLPFIVPITGTGEYLFQPISINDLTDTFVKSLVSLDNEIIDVVGPEIMSVQEIILSMRKWLDVPPGFIFHIPLFLIKIGGMFADILNLGPMRSNSINMMLKGGVGDYKSFHEKTGLNPISMKDFFYLNPSHVQDRWHSRLYFVRLLMPFCFFLLWLLSGITGYIHHPSGTDSILQKYGLPIWFSDIFCGIDIILALCWLFRFKIKEISFIQLFMVVGYTIGLSIFYPSLWMDGFGPLLKNIPIIILMITWLAIKEEK